MLLLLGFAFLAGIVTILSPCILPILPIILSSTLGGQETGKARPLGVVTGFVLSFTFFTLFLSAIVRTVGIPADTLRLVSIIIIASFGVSLLIPRFQALLEQLFARLSRFVPQGNTNPDLPAGRQGFAPGLLVGFSLGLLWTPCVGPILASVISLAITGTVNFDAFAITLAYSLGTAIPMFAIMIGGQNLLRRVPWLLLNTANIQKAFGILMILTAIAIFANFDRKFQTFILDKFPNYGVGLTKFEDNTKVQEQLKSLGSGETKKEDMGKPMFMSLQPKGIKAPELIPGGVWLNSEPLTLEQLQGKVVLVDFWTYSCINCQRTMPYLRAWWEKYKDQGLVIIGVHSPEFEFEKSETNLSQAIKDFKLLHPIMQDNDFATWKAYNNRYWPAKYFIDREGFIRYTHFGEGEYDKSERVIQELLAETGVTTKPEDINNPQYQVFSKTPETYLGFARINRFASPEQIVPDQKASYTAPKLLSNNTVAFEGEWTVTEEYANPQKGAKLYLSFESKEVFLVMRAPETKAKVKVYLDDKLQNFGEDNNNGVVTVEKDRLYKLINLTSPGRHALRLEFEDDNAELYAFTFG